MEQEKLGGVKTPEYVSLQFQLAGLGSRSAANIIDYTIIIVTQIVIMLLLLLAFNNSFSELFFGNFEVYLFSLLSFSTFYLILDILSSLNIFGGVEEPLENVC